MAASEHDYQKLAELKFRLRQTDAQAAEYFQVSQRTIQRWLKSSRFGEIAINYKADQLESAKNQIAGLADEIIGVMSTLMRTSKSDFVKLNSAITLGKWLGLEQLKEEVQDDDREEIRSLLQTIADNTAAPPMLPPPRPGGVLPELTSIVVEGQFTVEEGVEKREG